MGSDGTLTLCIPRRQVDLHWWLPAGGDPASLAERFASLPVVSRPDPDLRQASLRRRRLPDPLPPADGPQHESLGDHLLRCLETAVPLDASPPWIDRIRPGPDRQRGPAPLPGARPSLSRDPDDPRPLRAHLEACFAASLEATISSPSWPSRAMTAAGFHARLTLQGWHRGPLWIAIWRCHGCCGWQRRCGPMLLSEFLVHQGRLRHQSSRQSGAALRRSFPHGF
ncbi:MAG: hypothetical protein ACKOCM_00355 [Cyanobacteriota bacterium]